MDPVSRRDFLKTTSLALLAGGAVWNPLRQAWAFDPALQKEFFVLCDTDKEIIGNRDNVTLVTHSGSVNMLNASSGEIVTIDTPFFGHSVCQNPLRPHQLATFEKWGRRGALIDLKEKTVIAAAEAMEGNVFFGHAVFADDGCALIVAEDNYGRSQGQLVLRDPVTLKPIQKISSHGVEPHDCQSAKDGKSVMVVNEGFQDELANLAWVETASGKLLHKVMLDIEPGALFAHMSITHDGWICVTGFHRPYNEAANGRLVFISPDGTVMKHKIPADVVAKLHGEVLSIAFLGQSGLVGITVPDSNMVIVLNYKTGELIHALNIPKPKGILNNLMAPDNSFYVTSISERNMRKITLMPDGSAPDIQIEKTAFGGLGSHMARIYV